MSIKGYHTSNCGVLLEFKNKKVLFDGIWDDENHFSVKMPDKMRKDILNAREPFNDIDYLIFTHCHTDHFSEAGTIEYLKKNTKTKAVVPAGLLNCEELNDRILSIEGNGVLQLDEIEIGYYNNVHIDFNGLEKDPHYSYSLTMADKRILIAGDMKPVVENVDMLEPCNFDAVFLNPVFLGQKDYIDLMLRFNANKYYVYHLPVEEYDCFMFRPMAKRNVKRNQESCKDVILLLDEMETFEL
ncbi:MAG: MBL fold metallo-hydrolase [Emergencia sp.]